jgi:hypothetical protein
MAALLRRLGPFLLAAGGAPFATGCGADPVAPTGTRIDALIAGVTAEGGQVTAVLSDSAPPRASAGPLAHVPGAASVSHSHGGRARVSLTGGANFTRVYVSSPAASGRWDLWLPNGVTVEDLDVQVSAALRPGSLKVRYTLEGPSGVGGATEQTLEIGN